LICGEQLLEDQILQDYEEEYVSRFLQEVVERSLAMNAGQMMEESNMGKKSSIRPSLNIQGTKVVLEAQVNCSG